MTNPESPTKPWWASRTLIVNGIAALVVVGANAGIDWLPSVAPELQVIGLAIVNIVLRVVTKKPLTLN